MLRRLIPELAITFLLCLGERVLERIMFPGLHRMAGRMAAVDPARADDISALVAEALGLFAVVWVFNASLYAISWPSRRPLRPQLPTVVALIIVVLTFAAASAQWSTLSTTPAHAASPF